MDILLCTRGLKEGSLQLFRMIKISSFSLTFPLIPQTTMILSIPITALKSYLLLILHTIYLHTSACFQLLYTFPYKTEYFQIIFLWVAIKYYFLIFLQKIRNWSLNRHRRDSYTLILFDLKLSELLLFEYLTLQKSNISVGWKSVMKLVDIQHKLFTLGQETNHGRW